MEGIDGIGAFNQSFGLSAGGMKPAEMIDPNKTFSRILNETTGRNPEQTETAISSDLVQLSSVKPGDMTTAFPGIIPRQAHIDKSDELYEQCLALETFLVKNILNAMRKNVLKSSLVDTGFAGEIYEDMLWDEYAKEYTKDAGFGLADLAYLELTGQRGRKA